jgi:hypothetical protein
MTSQKNKTKKTRNTRNNDSIMWLHRLWTVLAIIALTMTLSASARTRKQKNNSPMGYKARFKDCEKGDECVNIFLEDPNCALRCTSHACWREVYMNEPLEPGEVDAKRRAQFDGCCRVEDRNNRGKRATEKKMAKDAAKLAKRGGGGETGDKEQRQFTDHEQAVADALT